MRKEFLRSGLEDENNIHEPYRAFLKGKDVHVTTWAEFILVIIAILSPLFLIEPAWKYNFFDFLWPAVGCVAVLMGVQLFLTIFLIVPFCRYNFAREIDWERH
jgi:hypothetical protein